jgi:hypothetical protein
VSLIPGESPLQFVPAADDRQHVPFFTPGDIDLLGTAEFGIDTKLAASDLWEAHRNSRLRQWVRQDLGLGWALDPRLRLLQIDGKFVRSRRERDRRRLEDERAFISQTAGGIDLLHRDLSKAEATEIAGAFLEAQISAWGTALIAPGLAHIERDPRILRNNRALLEAAIEFFEVEGLASPATDHAPFAKPRQLFALVAIAPKLLVDDKYARSLRESYAEYANRLYGYWVQAPNLESDAPPRVTRALGDFVYPLQDESRTNVVLDRVGPFGYGYQADGIAGNCMGTSAPEFITHPPKGYRPRLVAGQRDGFSLVVWNRVLLRNRKVDGERGRAGRRAYRRHPCGECGAHDAATPPRTPRSKKLHGFYWHRVHSADVCRGTIATTRRRFLRMVRGAREASVELGERVGHYYDALEHTLRRAADERFGDSG